jgi:hypothetical protein
MSYKLITLIVAKRKGLYLLEQLSEKKGIVTADKSNVRGSTIYDKNGVEMEILTVLVEQERADEIFEYLFVEAELDEAHQGLIYQVDLRRASKYSLS